MGIKPFLPAVLLCAAQIPSAAQSLPEQLIEAGHWKKARAIAEMMFREMPNDALTNFLLSQIRNAFGDHSTPLSFAEKAVELDGGTAKYHRQLAEVLGVSAQHANMFQQLLLARRFHKEIDIAIAQDGRNVQALRDLMEFYLLAPGVAGGDASKAAATAERIAGIDKAEGFLAQARLAEFHHDTAKQSEMLRNAAAVQPPNYRAIVSLGQFALSPDHTDLALAETQGRAALAAGRTRIDGYSILAEVFAARDQWNELDAILADAAKNVPDDASPWYRAADRIRMTGHDLPRAAAYLRTYLAQEPEGNQPAPADAHWKLGLILERQGHLPEAATEWKEAVRRDSNSPAKRELKRTRL